MTGEENQYSGVNINAWGENAQYEVYKEFEQIVNKENTPSVLVIRSFKLDHHPIKPLRTTALHAELGSNFTWVFSRGKFDNITPEELTKAEDQLQKGILFIQHIFHHITGNM